MKWLMFKLGHYGIPYPIRDAYYDIRNFFFPCHPRFRKAYKRWECHDIDMILPNTMFALLEDYWYVEVVGNDNVYGNPAEMEFEDSEVGRHERSMYESQWETFQWIEKTIADIEALRKNEERVVSGYREQNRIDEENHIEETRIMKEIIDHRGVLWT